jgi:hypothetical protein
MASNGTALLSMRNFTVLLRYLQVFHNRNAFEEIDAIFIKIKLSGELSIGQYRTSIHGALQVPHAELSGKWLTVSV